MKSRYFKSDDPNSDEKSRQRSILQLRDKSKRSKSQVGSRNGEKYQPPTSTPYVERQNLTLRMSLRRFPRLTNAYEAHLDME